MRILIAGGSSFVGRAITWAAVEAGHDVTVINRGVTPSDLPDSVTRLVGDRKGNLSALAGRTFDATIDTIAYQPADVVALAEALDGHGGHHVQISSVSAYQEPTVAGAREGDVRLFDDGTVDPASPVTGTTYGPLKAACEHEAVRRYGGDLAVLRPTYVIGAYDKTMRFPYWVHRVARGGRVAVPGPVTNDLQWIDARDLGAFAIRVAQERVSGAVHVTSEPLAMDAVIRETAEALGVDVEIVEVPAPIVLERNLLAALPLWAGPTGSLSLRMDSSAARGLGLTVRTLADSVRDTAQWLRAQTVHEHWLSASAEAELLASLSN